MIVQKLDPLIFRVMHHTFVFERPVCCHRRKLMSDVGWICQNIPYRSRAPLAGILIFRIDYIAPILCQHIGAGSGDLFFSQIICYRIAALSLGCEFKHFPDRRCHISIRHQMIPSLRIPSISKRGSAVGIFSFFCSYPHGRFDLSAGIASVPLVDDIFERSKFIVSISGIHIIIDRYESDIMGWKYDLRIIPGL